MKLPIIQPTVDPHTLGADCDHCPLKDRTPVLPKVNNNATLIVCGEAPGKEEVIQGVPFAGASGWFLDKQLRQFGVHRRDLHSTNSLLCRPPKKFSDAQWKQALACCRPRLEREISECRADRILALGGKATWSLTDPTGPFNSPCSRDKIESWFGAYLTSGRFQVMPSYHPAFVLRAPHFRDIFSLTLDRALNPPPTWVWPKIITQPGEEMRAALKLLLETNSPLGTDIENTGDPLKKARIRCIGVAATDLAVSVPVELNPTEENQLLLQILASSKMKVMHNAQHDLLGMKIWGIPVGGPVFDTILAHAVISPLLPHDLGFVCASYFHAPRWKAENKIGSEDRGLDLFVKKDIFALCTYNAKDSYMQRILMDALEPQLG